MKCDFVCVMCVCVYVALMKVFSMTVVMCVCSYQLLHLKWESETISMTIYVSALGDGTVKA